MLQLYETRLPRDVFKPELTAAEPVAGRLLVGGGFMGRR